MAPSAGPVLFVGGRVYTGRRYAEALLIDQGRVVEVGPLKAVSRRAPTGTRRIDLAGALVVPGLADAHLHVGELTRVREGPDLRGVASTAALVEKLARFVSEHPGSALVARGFDLAERSPSEWPTASELDRVSEERPVVIYDRSGHVAFLNHRALERVGLESGEAGKAPEGVVRDEHGRPTGVLLEEAMRRLGARVTEEEPPSASAVRRTLDGLAALGLTTVGAMSVSPKELAILNEVARETRLLPKLRCYGRLNRLHDFAEEYRSTAARAPLVGVKEFLDGAFGPRTASLTDPYADRSTRGVDVLDDRTLGRALAEAAERGLAPALHAIGDRAIVRACRLLREVPPVPGRPARIEHASLTPPAVLSALSGSRASLVVQPGFLLTDHWLAERLGPERSRWAYVFRTLFDRGAELAGSSDAPFCSSDPFEGIAAAVRRRDPEGRSANPERSEALPVEEALSLYTRHAHRSLGEPSGGSLETGSEADLVVLSVPRLSDLAASARPVAQSWVGGLRVFPTEA